MGYLLIPFQRPLRRQIYRHSTKPIACWPFNNMSQHYTVSVRRGEEIPFEQEDPSRNNVASPKSSKERNPHRRTRTCKSGPTPTLVAPRNNNSSDPQISATTILFYTVWLLPILTRVYFRVIVVWQVLLLSDSFQVR